MEITWLGFLSGLLLLAIPVYIIVTLRLHRMRQFVAALGRMVALVTLAGALMELLVRWDSMAANIVAGVAMVLVGAVMTIRQARLRMSRLIVPVLSGMAMSAFVIGLYILFLVLGLRNPFEARYLIPVLGLLVGGSVGVNARALHTYYMGLQHHHQLYDYLVGNGGTHREAVAYFTRRCFIAALAPMLRVMWGMVLVVAPGEMLVLVMAGVSVETSLMLQIVLMVAALAVSFGSLYITLAVGRRYGFDAYGRPRT